LTYCKVIYSQQDVQYKVLPKSQSVAINVQRSGKHICVCLYF